MDSGPIKPSAAISLYWVNALWSDALASRGDIVAIRQERKRLAQIRHRLHRWSPITAAASAIATLAFLVITSFSNPAIMDVFTAFGAGCSLSVAVLSAFIYVTTG